MLYCNTCGDERLWPRNFSQSYGQCEICGKCDPCSDVPSGVLPAPGSLESLLGDHGISNRPDMAAKEQQHSR